MKRTPIVKPNEPPKITLATRGPNRDGVAEGEVWFSGDGTHIWRKGRWVEISELGAEQEKKS